MRTIRVELGQRAYPVYVAAGLLDALGPLAAKNGLSGRCAVVADAAVLGALQERVRKSLVDAGFAPVIIPVEGGEGAKTMAQAERVVGAMLEARLDRQSCVFALGGGSIGDLAGFVAATYMRGVTWAQVPTTLLAQVDASVGGKVAVNHPLGKNLIGAFHQPSLVLADPKLLETLPSREMWSGTAEIVKTALIADPALVGRLEADLERLARRRSLDLLGEIVSWAVGIKAEIVAQDEKESGRRMILNFGHTLGHALEAAGGYNRWRHGEAVTLGMAAALYVSSELGALGFMDLTRALRLLERIEIGEGFSDLDPRAVVDMALRDKKARGGKLRFVVLEGIGKAEVTERASEELLVEALRAVQGRAAEAAPAAAEDI